MTKNKKKFEVRDWANNLMNWGVFETFDDAWVEIMRREPVEENQGEYYAVEIGS